MRTIAIAKVLILDAEDNVLVLRRSDTHPTLASRRDLPGGQLDEGESPTEALVREIQEETGLYVEPNAVRVVYAGAEVWQDESRVRTLFAAQLKGERPAITLSWEHSEHEWLPLATIASIEKEFHGFYYQALEYIRTNHIIEDL